MVYIYIFTDEPPPKKCDYHSYVNLPEGIKHRWINGFGRPRFWPQLTFTNWCETVSIGIPSNASYWETTTYQSSSNGQVKICLKNCLHTLWYSNMAVNLTICQKTATEWSKPSQVIPKQISQINPNYYSSIGLNLHVWWLIPIKNMD